MKKIINIFLLGGILLAAATQAEAQSGRKLTQADAAKLPSHRPMPDMAAMQQKLAKMRADAKRQQALQNQINDNRRQLQENRQIRDSKQPVTSPVKQ